MVGERERETCMTIGNVRIKPIPFSGFYIEQVNHINHVYHMGNNVSREN